MVESDDPATVWVVARLVLDSHARGVTCQRCTESGCDQVPWAERMVEWARQAWPGECPA